MGKDSDDELLGGSRIGNQYMLLDIPVFKSWAPQSSGGAGFPGGHFYCVYLLIFRGVFSRMHGHCFPQYVYGIGA